MVLWKFIKKIPHLLEKHPELLMDDGIGRLVFISEQYVSGKWSVQMTLSWPWLVIVIGEYWVHWVPLTCSVISVYIWYFTIYIVYTIIIWTHHFLPFWAVPFLESIISVNKEDLYTRGSTRNLTRPILPPSHHVTVSIRSCVLRFSLSPIFFY